MSTSRCSVAGCGGPRRYRVRGGLCKRCYDHFVRQGGRTAPLSRLPQYAAQIRAFHAAGLSQHAMATQLDVSQKTVWAWCKALGLSARTYTPAEKAARFRKGRTG
jgi:transposase-like protein